MIYIGKICLLPCKACDACCSCVSDGCRALGKSCQGCCDAVSDFFGPITQNPLGGYVIGTWVTMALVGAGSGYTLSQVKGTICDDAKMVCYVNIGLAVIHGIFAYYCQRRVVGALGGQPAQQMSHSEIAAKARHVMLYDVGFCLYVFVFAGSFFYNCSALGQFGDCVNTGPAWSAAGLMIIYGFGVWNYAICWYGCQCCCGQFEARMPKASAGVVMGAPAGAAQP